MKSQNELLLERIQETVLNNLSDENFGVVELSRELGMSRSGLFRKIKRLKGKSASQFIREIRLRKAVELLNYDAGSISEIAYRVGFSSNTYFNRCFVSYYGYSPRAMRKKMKSPKCRAVHSMEVTIQKLSKWPSSMFRIIRNHVSFFLILVFLSFIFPWKTNLKSLSQHRAIAVLPIENLTGDSQKQNLACWLHEMLINELGKMEELDVVSKTSILIHNQQEWTMRKMASQLKIGYIVEGAMMVVDDSLRFNINLVSVYPLESHIFAKAYYFDMQDLISIDENLMNVIARDIKLSVSTESAEDANHKYARNKS